MGFNTVSSFISVRCTYCTVLYTWTQRKYNSWEDNQMYWYCIVLVPYLNGRISRTIISHPLVTTSCKLHSSCIFKGQCTQHCFCIRQVAGILYRIFPLRGRYWSDLSQNILCHSLYCVLQSLLLLPTSSQTIRPRLPEMGFFVILWRCI